MKTQSTPVLHASSVLLILGVLTRPCAAAPDRTGPNVPLPDTQAWWPLDEAEGQVVHDRSGNGLHGYRGLLDEPDDADPELRTTQGMAFSGAACATVPLSNQLTWPDVFTLDLELRLARPLPDGARCQLRLGALNVLEFQVLADQRAVADLPKKVQHKAAPTGTIQNPVPR